MELLPWGGGCGLHTRLLGLLAGAVGEPDRAAAHFEEALALCRKARYIPELAWTCVDYAHTLLQQGRSEGSQTPSARAKATALLDEGVRLAQELGMKPLVERALRDKDLLTA